MCIVELLSSRFIVKKKCTNEVFVFFQPHFRMCLRTVPRCILKNKNVIIIVENIANIHITMLINYPVFITLSVLTLSLYCTFKGIEYNNN